MIHMERHGQIMEILQERRCVTVDYLSKKLYTSGATIRRDLQKMEEEGLLKRVRGGAVLVGGTYVDVPVMLRANRNREAKTAIARLALPYVKSASTIFMDSSSTVAELARLCEGVGEKSIISNGVDTLNVLNDFSNVKLYSTGGMIQNRSAYIGTIAQNAVASRYADVLFFSCCGVSAQWGVTEATEENAVIKRAMANNSQSRILLADFGKLNQVYFCKTCGIDMIDVVITDKKPPEEFMEAAGCDFIYPETD